MSFFGTKRSASSTENSVSVSGAPTKKRPKMDFDFDVKFIATSQDELDIGLLRVQNRRLTECLAQRQRVETELRQRLEQMEKKQLNDDTKLYAINRYWNQLNEDMRLILQRFDSTAVSSSNDNQNQSSNDDEDDEHDDDDDVDDDDENSNEQPIGHHRRSVRNKTSSFIRQLANLDKEELDEQLQKRVLLSTRAVSKVLQAFDRIVQRNEKIMTALKDRTEADPCEDNQQDTPDEPDTIKSPDHDDGDDDDCNDLNDLQRPKKKKKSHPKLNLDEAVRQLNEELTKENKSLNMQATTLHQENRTLSLKYAQMRDKIESKDLQLDELKNRIDELEFELNKSRTREQRLEDHLIEAREKLRDFQQFQTSNSASGNTSLNSDNATSKQDSAISLAKIDDLKRELEEQREMAASRLQELEQLNNEHKETLKLVEKYRMDLQCLPDSVIKESAEFKSLQSHFSVLFNESMQLKLQLDETRQQLAAAKNVHMRQIEQMEAEELTMQKRLRNDCMQLEDALAQVRKESEMLRLEFEQTLTANEQTGPINREMRNLITSLQNHNQQLKGESTRIKKKFKEYIVEIGRLKHIIEQNGLKVCCGGILLPGQKTLDNGSSTTCTVDCCSTNQQTQKLSTDQQMIKNEPPSDDTKPTSQPIKQEESECKIEYGSMTPLSTTSNISTLTTTTSVKTESSNDNQPQLMIDSNEPKTTTNVELLASGDDSNYQLQQTLYRSKPKQDLPESSRPKPEEVRDLKSQLKKSYEANRELKLLLDIFKSIDKEKREKAQIMANEKKLRMENDELRQQNKKILEEKRLVAGGGHSWSLSGGLSSTGGDVSGRRYSTSGTSGTTSVCTTSSKISDEEHKKMSKYEDIIRELQKSVNIHKQQEEALLNEMEVTGQAFEDMQDQNCKLIQQLREKDDANFKLMSERIKSNQLHILLKEEKEMLTEQIVSLQQQLETQNQVIRKLEDKERMLQNSLTTTEKELTLRQQAMDFLKRKALESSQSAADLKLHLDKYVAQIKDAQSIVADKTSAWQQEIFKTKRLHEEVIMYKRKYERAKKFELATTADEVLQEEIRELREELTCPSCKTKRKDAVLNKCFHVFCYDCLKTRYETRQRKCPKCNQSFSANDFHRLYLA